MCDLEDLLSTICGAGSKSGCAKDDVRLRNVFSLSKRILNIIFPSNSSDIQT